MKQTDEIRCIKGIGEKTAKLLQKLGIYTVGDLLSYYPRSYETYELPVPIGTIREGKTVTIEASVIKSADVTKYRNLQVLTCIVRDPSGTLKLTWYNQPYMKNQLTMGTRHLFRGRIVRKNGALVMEQPKKYKREEYGRLLQVLWPIYGLTEGLHNTTLSKAVAAALAGCEREPELLPAKIAKEHDLIPHRSAVEEIHFPKSRETLAQARKRLVFEEFFRFMLLLTHYKEQKGKEENHYPIRETKECERLISGLPYELTNAQKKVWEEIKADIAGEGTMARLVQGDVGSGKTILAMLAMLAAVESGYQAALMAPTEVLARQHMTEALRLFSEKDVRCVLLTGSMTAAQKKEARERIKSGEADIIIGTQTLFQEKMEYSSLGLVITDEQHRFGVRQRELFSEKGGHPHILVMSATPIPRTLAIILYGDLDISIVDELPKGRKPIKNCVVGTNYRETAYRFIAKQIANGRQAYVICAMAEESDTTEAENVIDYTEQLREAFGGGICVEYLHGKMPAKEKTVRMNRFAEGEIQVLVSTTVVEVGVNVPNATVMMIENAERFGLAQLHQLRGRVGRGDAESYCIMVSSSDEPETMERLEILNKSNDGFFIAGEDLRLRGPGDLFGVRQSGELEFMIADIYADAAVLKEVSETVNALSEKEAGGLYRLWFKEETAEIIRDMAESI
ncbi:MAG: ATP-dependent DNA helicase RecG [Lachnospiraceae bacterium]|nr:ATP-dependent DNA helicase RecG [Lachnospiraceae bacterium]